MKLLSFVIAFAVMVPLFGRAIDQELASAQGEPPIALEQPGYRWQGKDARWWARRAVQARKDANKRGLTIKRLKRELRVKWAPTVDYAYRLAATTYGVSVHDLRTIGHCESKHHPLARNGQYRGVMQEGPMFERGPFGRADFSVWDPIANVMTAAHARVQDGSWRQWQCKP